jgi:hypothetical protein
MIAMTNASVLRSTIAGSIFCLFAAACAPAAAAAPPAEMSQFDGKYRGTLTLVWAGGVLAGNLGPSTCEVNMPEQVMSVSGNQVYLERKSIFRVAPLLLAGTVGTDGSVSAAGVTQENLGGGRGPTGPQSIFFTLTGKIENNEFSGALNDRFCNYSVKLKR